MRQWAPLVRQLQQELKQHAGATQAGDCGTAGAHARAAHPELHLRQAAAEVLRCCCRTNVTTHHLQRDDPPEAVGPFSYFTRSNPHGPDTILRRCIASGMQQLVLSAEAMQADAAAASRLLGLEAQG